MQLTLKCLALGVLTAAYTVVSRSANMWCTVYEVELREGNPIHCDVITSAVNACEYSIPPCTAIEWSLGWRTDNSSPQVGRQEVS